MSGELAKHLGASLVRIGAAWLIGTAAGECWAGLCWPGHAGGPPFISALFPAPKIALLPPLILWFGIGVASKVAIIARCKRIDSGGSPEVDEEQRAHDQAETNRTRHL